MKLILAQPATPRFQWELDVLLTNIRSLTDMDVVLLFKEQDFTVPLHFERDWGCGVFVYEDRRDYTKYLPNIRPWLLWQYLAGDPAREQETYFYIDSDVIFREWIHFATLPFSEKTIVGSDVSGYLNYDYLIKCQMGQEIISRMAEICEIDVEQMKGVPGIGAHLILDKPKAAFWERSYHDSNRIHYYLNPLNSNIQKWTAEMWAQQWGWIREGYKLVASPELDFIRPTDPVEDWEKVKILHNAGVVDRNGDLFFKGAYDKRHPFDDDFSHINKAKASIKYVEAIKKVIH